MITPTLTSDPALALELGRRLAASARRPHHSMLATFWIHLLLRPTLRRLPHPE